MTYKIRPGCIVQIESFLYSINIWILISNRDKVDKCNLLRVEHFFFDVPRRIQLRESLYGYDTVEIIANKSGNLLNNRKLGNNNVVHMLLTQEYSEWIRTR